MFTPVYHTQRSPSYLCPHRPMSSPRIGAAVFVNVLILLPAAHVAQFGSGFEATVVLGDLVVMLI